MPTAQEYTRYRELSDNAIYLQPAENEGEVTNIYNYTYVTENPIKPNPIINNNYDYSSPTTYNNYPVTNNYNFPDLSNPTDTYIQNIYNYYTEPNANESTGTLNQNDLTNNIPILSNLKNRFPFSIPFDIYNLLKGLSVERETPYIDYDLEFPRINYVYHLHVDLHQFDDLADLFRTLQIIAFIIGLCYFSYDHFFGS